HVPVSFGTAIAVESPDLADLADLVEVEIGDDHCILVARPFDDELAARRGEVALAVELADRPGLLDADAVDRADPVAVRDRVRRLLEVPEVLGEPGDRRARVQHELGPAETEDPRALGEMAVVADVDADVAEGRLEDRITEVPGLEVELLPEPGRAVRNVL